VATRTAPYRLLLPSRETRTFISLYTERRSIKGEDDAMPEIPTQVVAL
jgi:hypothetical protein